MPTGYRTLDGIDFNQILYGPAGLQPALDLYRSVDLPIIRALAMPWGERLYKYYLSEKNGFQRLGPVQRPDRKIVVEATMTPFVEKFGYGVGTDLDTLRRSTGQQVMADLARPMKEDPEHVLTQFISKMMTNPGTNNAGYGFYNGQFATEEKLTAPPNFRQRSFPSDHNHYLTSKTATDLAVEDFTAVKETIRHHGHNGALAGFLNANGVRVLEELAAFDNGSIIRSPISDQTAVLGFNDIFTIWGITFHSTEVVPDGYVLVVETNPSDETGRPLVLFEPDNIKGLNMYPGPNPNYPLIESYWDRWMGVKVFQRGAGVALQYSTPSVATVYDDPVFI
jgi:hypothetical protein